VKISRGTDRTTEPDQYHARIDAAHLAPLWTFFKEWFAAVPRPEGVAHLWRYDAIRPLLLESASTISTDEAERRVLVLENPGLAGRRTVTDSLYAGLQLIMPGEIARSHRHTAAALRFIIEGSGTYTAVAGEKCYMEPGDFIVTPSWAWHDHGNESHEPTVWLDVLDVPLIRFFGAGFSEHYSEPRYPETAPPLDSHYRYGRNMLPAGFRRQSATSPIFSYPYARARETLDRLKAQTEWDPCHALKMEYIDPTSGGPAIPTISTFLQLVPQGFGTRRYASTAGAVVCVVTGHGRITIGRDDAQSEIDYQPRDLLAVPSWHDLTIHADEETVLFSASDEAVQRKLGVWRERRA
jgi:gentisate 1,2-dioxygenase